MGRKIIKDGLNGKIIAAPLKEGSEVMQQALFNTMKWFIEHLDKYGTRDCTLGGHLAL